MRWLKAWWRANVIDADPHPEHGNLDQRDGLITDQTAFDALAARLYGGRK